MKKDLYLVFIVFLATVFEVIIDFVSGGSSSWLFMAFLFPAVLIPYFVYYDAPVIDSKYLKIFYRFASIVFLVFLALDLTQEFYFIPNMDTFSDDTIIALAGTVMILVMLLAGALVLIFIAGYFLVAIHMRGTEVESQLAVGVVAGLTLILIFVEGFALITGLSVLLLISMLVTLYLFYGRSIRL